MKQFNSCILALNFGSSSFKFSLFEAESMALRVAGAARQNEDGFVEFDIRDGNGQLIREWFLNAKKLEDAVDELVQWLKANEQEYPIVAIGHRIVQGGPFHMEPVVINDELLDDLKKFFYLDSNHLPEEVKIIRIFKAAFPLLQQVACFDTCFHKDMPAQAKYYPLPEKYRSMGLMRYGFHGLSYEYNLQKLAEQILYPARQKIIIAHLGNGASMVAIKNGTGIDTTMGISPMGGLVMGTRPGDLDPGAILFLMQQGNLSLDEVDSLLSKGAGLLAIAGISDVQELLKQEKINPKAKEALAAFCYQAKKAIGGLAAAMGGLDTLVFTGGIGENSEVIRSRICKDLSFLGLFLDQKANHEGREIISMENSWVTVCAFKTNEERVIAQHTRKIITIQQLP